MLPLHLRDQVELIARGLQSERPARPEGLGDAWYSIDTGRLYLSDLNRQWVLVAEPITPAAPAAGTKSLCQGRLSISTDPVNTTLTSSTSIKWVPYLGNTVALWSGTQWEPYDVAAPITKTPPGSGTYDVFLYLDGSAVDIEFIAWSGGRTEALGKRDGIEVRVSDNTRRYVGTIYVLSGAIIDDGKSSHVWNRYHRLTKHLHVQESPDATWTANNSPYSGSIPVPWSLLNNDVTNSFQFVVGLQETTIEMQHDMYATGNACYPGIGTAGFPGTYQSAAQIEGFSLGNQGRSVLNIRPTPGVYTYYLLQFAPFGAATVYGRNVVYFAMGGTAVISGC